MRDDYGILLPLSRRSNAAIGVGAVGTAY